jgi:hypothetical protein
MLVALTFASLSLAPITATQAADWSDTAFPVKAHNFGTVAVAAKTEFQFPIYNNFSSTMHVRSVRASCGCTTPIIQDSYINPGQSGVLLARFNTNTFKGQHGATLTVVIDQPFYSEVRLRVDGYVRSDMVFHPGAVEFGRLDQGEGVTKASKVYYAGRNDWQILDVQINRPWLLPAVKQVDRGGGRVTYEISIGVREDAPTGFFQDELVVMTNDRTMPRVPLRVSGQVESALTISPQAIALGRLKPGQSVTQKMILLGKMPFAIDSIKAEGWDIKFTPSTETKKTHILFPEFTSTTFNAGPRKSTIEITTAGEESVTAKALLTADIRDR